MRQSVIGIMHQLYVRNTITRTSTYCSSCVVQGQSSRMGGVESTQSTHQTPQQNRGSSAVSFTFSKVLTDQPPYVEDKVCNIIKSLIWLVDLPLLYGLQPRVLLLIWLVMMYVLDDIVNLLNVACLHAAICTLDTKPYKLCICCFASCIDITACSIAIISIVSRRYDAHLNL